MKFFVQSIVKGFVAAPFLFWSKLFFEIKWNFICGIALLVCIAGVFTHPAFLIFLPFFVAASHGAFSLGSLHSMLEYMGLAREFKSELMPQELLKASIIRGVAYFIAGFVTFVILLFFYGWSEFTSAYSNFETYIALQKTHFENGRLPMLIAAIFISSFLFLVMEALIAVPMAAAAFGLGPSDHYYNGLWGLGFAWGRVFLTWLVWGLFLILFTAFVLHFAASEFHLRSVFHLLGSFWAGTPPDLETYPLQAPKFEQNWQKFLAMIQVILVSYMQIPIWAATCANAFKLRKEKDVLDGIDQAPSPEERQQKYATHLDKVRALRSGRMPSR